MPCIYERHSQFTETDLLASFCIALILPLYATYGPTTPETSDSSSFLPSPSILAMVSMSNFGQERVSG